jgi:hypothetical protein
MKKMKKKHGLKEHSGDFVDPDLTVNKKIFKKIGTTIEIPPNWIDKPDPEFQKIPETEAIDKHE